MELKICEPIFLEEFGVKVNKYLTNAQIQNIANEIIKYQTWAEREEIKNYLILNYATDIPKEKIDKMDSELIETSGLMDEIKFCIENLWDIDTAVKYEESIAKQLGVIIDKLPDIVKKAIDNASK